jgi:hypothetical protein
VSWDSDAIRIPATAYAQTLAAITMRQILLIIIMLATRLSFAQCLDRDKVVISGDFGFVDYIMHCPTYNFSFEGDTSKHWNILNDPIDISQVPYLIGVKNRLELKLRDYAGDNFFSKLEFYTAEISYADSIEKFQDRGPKVELIQCRAKYFFYYYFVPTPDVRHCVGIALNEREEILSKLTIPSKEEYIPVDNSLTICEVIKIAKQTNPQIEPIDKISLDLDVAKKQYSWTVSQIIVKPVEGENEFNEVLINASDRTKTIQTKGKSFIQFHKRFKTR